MDHRQTYYGDDPSIAEILAAVKKACGITDGSGADAEPVVAEKREKEKVTCTAEGVCE